MLLMALALLDGMTGAGQSAPPVTPPAATAASVAPPPAAAQPVTAAPAATATPVAISAGSANQSTDAGAAGADQAVPGSAAADTTTPNPAPTVPVSIPPGAASSTAGADPSLTDYTAQPRDPWVKVNRTIFSLDVAMERHLLAPVAHGYNAIVPHVVRYHVTSALFNIEEPLTAINDLLQLRFKSFGQTFYRFVVNSTVGIGGLFDVAKKAGVPIHFSLFGQTLGRYGVKPGPYVMLPVLGPSSVRDSVGRLVDGLIDPVQFLVGGLTSPDGLSLFVLEGVDWRSNADATMKAVYSATDPYAFVRSAYTQYSAANVAKATGKAAALPDFDAAPGTP